MENNVSEVIPVTYFYESEGTDFCPCILMNVDWNAMLFEVTAILVSWKNGIFFCFSLITLRWKDNNRFLMHKISFPRISMLDWNDVALEAIPEQRFTVLEGKCSLIPVFMILDRKERRY